MEVKLRNRSSSTVHYSIEDGHIKRSFMPREVKKVSSEEVEKLCFEEGGRVLLEQYLQLSDKELAEKLELNTNPEYWYDENDIKTILQGNNIELFEDAMDYAPEGMIDLIKDLAVSLPVTDNRKLEIIKKKTGFDAYKAQEYSKEEIKPATNEVTGRRTAPLDKSTTSSTIETGRRTAPLSKPAAPRD